MIYEEFLEKQNGIYEKFDLGMTTARLKGFKTDPSLAESKGGYLLALRPSWEVQSFAASFAALCLEGVVAYGPSAVHTTISDYKLAAGFDPANDPDRERILKIFKRICGNSLVDALVEEPISCIYRDPVFNETTLILKGIPDPSFVRLAGVVVEEARREGIELRMPWGGHVTLARFAVPVGPRLVEPLDWMVGKIQVPRTPQTFLELVIGQFTSTPLSFDFKVIERFQLPSF